MDPVVTWEVTSVDSITAWRYKFMLSIESTVPPPPQCCRYGKHSHETDIQPVGNCAVQSPKFSCGKRSLDTYQTITCL